MVILTITRIEVEHLVELVGQFIDLLPESGLSGDSAPAVTDDPALGRLVPEAYLDDDEAAGEFRRVTQSDLLGRRREDAERMRSDLMMIDAQHTENPPRALEATAVVDIPLDEEGARAWLRTFTALRLVIASRLGIESESDHDEDDPRFGVYDWLGYRLDGLVRAIES